MSLRRVGIYAHAVRPCTGSTRVVLGLARGLVAAGHEVHIHGRHLDRAGIRGVGAQAHPHGWRWLPRPLLRKVLGGEHRHRWLYRGLGRRGYQVLIGDGEPAYQDALLLHSLARGEAEVLGMAIQKRYGRTIAWQEHWLRAHRFGVLVANSNLMAREVTARYGIAGDDVVVLYPAVDPAFSEPDPGGHRRAQARQALGLGDEQFLMGFITSGKLALRGIDTLVEVAAALPPGCRLRLRVLLVCGARDAQGVTAAFAQRGLAGQLILRGKTEQIESYLRALDLLLHPARFETFGMGVVEAAASGCPVVTSERTGAAELFTGAGRAAVAPLPTVAELLPRVQRMMEEPAHRAAVAAAQAAQVRALGWAHYATRLLAEVAQRVST